MTSDRHLTDEELEKESLRQDELRLEKLEKERSKFQFNNPGNPSVNGRPFPYKAFNSLFFKGERWDEEQSIYYDAPTLLDLMPQLLDEGYVPVSTKTVMTKRLEAPSPDSINYGGLLSVVENWLRIEPVVGDFLLAHPDGRHKIVPFSPKNMKLMLEFLKEEYNPRAKKLRTVYGASRKNTYDELGLLKSGGIAITEDTYKKFDGYEFTKGSLLNLKGALTGPFGQLNEEDILESPAWRAFSQEDTYLLKNYTEFVRSRSKEHDKHPMAVHLGGPTGFRFIPSDSVPTMWLWQIGGVESGFISHIRPRAASWQYETLIGEVLPALPVSPEDESKLLEPGQVNYLLGSILPVKSNGAPQTQGVQKYAGPGREVEAYGGPGKEVQKYSGGSGTSIFTRRKK